MTKRLLSLTLVLFLLAKMGPGPGAKVYMGHNGEAVAEKEKAYVTSNIKEAYELQNKYSDNWEIITD